MLTSIVISCIGLNFNSSCAILCVINIFCDPQSRNSYMAHVCFSFSLVNKVLPVRI